MCAPSTCSLLNFCHRDEKYHSPHYIIFKPEATISTTVYFLKRFSENDI